MSEDEDEIMRRRAFIASSLSAASLVVADGVIDSAARPSAWSAKTRRGRRGTPLGPCWL